MKLNFALIGCGRISLKHVDALVANGDNILAVAFVDVIKSRAKERAMQYKEKMIEKGIKVEPEVFDDYTIMLNKIKPDLVSVATESGYHHFIVKDCLASNCHVICEKPMALSIKDADEMIEYSKKYNKKLAISFQNRFNHTVQLARKAYEEGRFGKIINVTGNIRWNRDMNYYKQAPWRGTWKLDGGTLMNQCTHNIDLLQWFLGSDITEVYGVTARFCKDIEAEDFGSAILKTKNGAIGIIEGSANTFPKNLEETLYISGTNGTVKLGGLAINKIENWRFSDSDKVGDNEENMINTAYELGNDYQAVYGFGHIHLYKDMIEAIKNDRTPYISAEEGKKALQIILAIYKSQKTGKPVKLPLKDFSTEEMDDKYLIHFGS